MDEIGQLLAAARHASALSSIDVPATDASCTPVEFGLWLDESLARPGAYHLAFALVFTGLLNLPRLREVVGALVGQHPALGFHYPQVNGAPLRGERPPLLADFPITRVPEEHWKEHTDAFVSQPFDLGKGPLVRLHLLQASAQRSQLVLVCHHLVADARSLHTLAHEIATVYLGGTAPRIRAEYRRFASLWQERLAEPHADAVQQFWRHYLSPPIPMYAMASPAPAEAAAGLPCEHFQLIDNTSFVALARRFNVTPFITGLALLAHTLFREHCIDDLIVGVPVELGDLVGREWEVGNFVNTILVRINLRRASAFADFVNLAQEGWHAAFDHRETPLIKLLEELPALRTPSGRPALTIMYGWQMRRDNRWQNDECTVQRVRLERRAAVCPIAIEFVETNRGLELSVEYDAASVGRRLAVSVIEGIGRTLGQAVSQVGDSSFRSEVQLEAAPKADAAPRHILSRFDEAASRWPERVAVEMPRASRTYGQVLQQSMVLAKRLERLRKKAGEIVLIRGGSLDFVVVAIFGCWRAGFAALLEPEDAAVLERAAIAAIPVAALIEESEGHYLRLAPHGGIAGTLRLWESKDRAKASAGEPQPFSSLEHLAYVVITSGSTGEGRAVGVSHAALGTTTAAWGTIFAFDAQPLRHAQCTRYSFDVFYGNLVRALSYGGTLVDCPRPARRDATLLADFLVQSRIGFIETVPMVMRALLALWQRGRPMPPLAFAVVGSDLWCDEEFIPLAKVLPQDCRLFNTYGLSEATIDSLYFEYTGGITVVGRTSLGRPLPGTLAFVVDENLHLVAPGEGGELLLGGSGLAEGYLQDPVRTSERFVNFTVDRTIHRVHRTGDKVRLIGTRLCFEGRLDAQFSIGGVRVEPEAVERVIKGVPGVADAAVGVVRSEGKRVLTAFLEIDSEPATTIAEVRRYLRKQIREGMQPHVICAVDRLPRSPNGKLDRHAVESLPIVEEPNLVLAAEEADTSWEKNVASAVAEVLGITGPIPPHRNFFALGGCSLDAARLSSFLAQRHGCRISLACIFQHPTIREIAAEANASMATSPAPELDSESPLFVNDVFWRPTIAPTRPISMPSLCVLTGYTGRLGNRIRELFLERTALDLFLLGRKQPAEAVGRCHWRAFDLARPEGAAWPSASAVVHAAYAVDFLSDYVTLRERNVLAVQSLLNEALQQGSPFHFLSSSSVEAFATPAEIRGGYNQTKWAAECASQAASQAGLPVVIYRIAHVIDSDCSTAHVANDFFWCFVKSCLQLGFVPEMDVQFDSIDLASVAETVVAQVLEPAPAGTSVVRIVNRQPASASSLLELLRPYGRVQSLPLPEWHIRLCAKFERDHTVALFPFAPLLQAPESIPQIFDARPRLAEPCPRTIQAEVVASAEALISRQIQHHAATGWLRDGAVY